MVIWEPCIFNKIRKKIMSNEAFIYLPSKTKILKCLNVNVTFTVWCFELKKWSKQVRSKPTEWAISHHNLNSFYLISYRLLYYFHSKAQKILKIISEPAEKCSGLHGNNSFIHQKVGNRPIWNCKGLEKLCSRVDQLVSNRIKSYMSPSKRT